MTTTSPGSTLSRRQFLGSTGLLAAGFCLFPKTVFAQAESPVTAIKTAAATAKIVVTKLRGNLSMLEGSGGNIAVLNGPAGKLLVDAGIGVSQPQVAAALASISAAPVHYLVNTHWHFDHADGNEWIHQAGATIIAQENTRKHLKATVRVDDWNYTFPPAPQGALPTILFANEKELEYNGERIRMQRYQPAHTDCDISVYFPKADVLHVADTFWNGHYPFIDYSTNGSIDGMIAAARQNIARTTERTIIIPGHGPIGNRAQLIEFHDMLVDIRTRVAALKKQGLTLAQVTAEQPTAKYDAKWGGFVISASLFTHLVYKGV
ncbi:MBL fold metallo-hydrolase [Hymenobacter negativus]|uniref:MBL fold metallo-hydrolase n=1 Tax=Hymenobacter negativus TaxID=2795026 RepID=A0ABS3QLJ2_9BACT|nr:MBL fold metallo-hydrolase [Hymenobacter negativus]MBO2012134.1 MBL fold metallo-hydrolase [Hymenobacter negativus]